ncbi:lipid-A-disaccharide synthase [Sodalis sp. CWE]|uniref:lipid-A-disaccharide synthase n=1 Tax=Sodalis sp. CWE TaxID=2803816 RepID=UPI001C7DECE7|nr:lipid-A-disaccharide synthase [Sodalis sp. CWE]MBX4180868.1 lipid-A-disaccharide synthase [Sodalis sp. CWE]
MGLISRSVTIGLVSGETSGDILGAGLMNALREYLPNVKFFGVAGENMRTAGIEVWYNAEELMVMGIFETVKYLPKLLRIRRDLEHRFIALQPDVFIGIDVPDFTISLENKLKQRGIRTIHYVSPSIWAWRKNRVHKIGRATDNVLALFPFEKSIYDYHNVPCKFIGHPVADFIPFNPDKTAARVALGIPVEATCLALLPGSRQSEIEMLGADFLRTAEQLYRNFPGLEIIVPLVNSNHCAKFKRIKAMTTPTLPLRILNHRSSIQAMIAANVALLASGTATLECMLAKCPMVVGYRMKPLSFAIARRLIKTKWISLPNLLADHELVKEFLQEKCHPDALANALGFLLEDSDHQINSLLTTFRQMHRKIRCNANEQAARAVMALIKR